MELLPPLTLDRFFLLLLYFMKLDYKSCGISGAINFVAVFFFVSGANCQDFFDVLLSVGLHLGAFHHLYRSLSLFDCGLTASESFFFEYVIYGRVAFTYIALFWL
jgi:hypothetical protein